MGDIETQKSFGGRTNCCPTIIADNLYVHRDLIGSLYFYTAVTESFRTAATKAEKQVISGAASAVKTMFLKLIPPGNSRCSDNLRAFTMFLAARIFWLGLRSGNMKSFERLSARGVKAVYDASSS